MARMSTTEVPLSVADVTYEQLAGAIDHSLLRPELTVAEVEDGCGIAARYRVVSVCARPADVPRCVELLGDTQVAVGTVIGFPHGAHATATKVFEAERALADGAVELDMVLNIGRLRSGDDAYVEADIRAVVDAARGAAIVKVILENAYLTDEEKVRGCKLVEAAGADFVKTSTGFAPSGSTPEDLRLMRATVSDKVQVKAAGGVRTLDALLGVLALGVTRVGATATATILDDYTSRTRA
jgi:deoxyribose-phosphate aldolase